jgi:hypothetical protein
MDLHLLGDGTEAEWVILPLKSQKAHAMDHIDGSQTPLCRRLAGQMRLQDADVLRHQNSSKSCQPAITHRVARSAPGQYQCGPLPWCAGGMASAQTGLGCLLAVALNPKAQNVEKGWPQGGGDLDGSKRHQARQGVVTGG